MKKLQIVLLLSIFAFCINAQVRIYPEAKPGYQQRIRDHIENQRVVDTHEHLFNPARIAESGMCDFTLLLHHYASDDIRSSGMPRAAFARLLTDSLSVMEKWKAVEPFWENSKNTAYSRVVLLAINQLFGIDKLDETTVEPLSAKIKEVYQTDWHKTIFEEKCKMDFIIIDGSRKTDDRSFGNPEIFRYVQQFNYLRFFSKSDMENVAFQNNMNFQTVDDLVVSLEKDFQNALEKGFEAVKVPDAYHRSLYFEDTKKENAGEALKMILESKERLPLETIKPLSDYMMHRLIELARKYNKPIQIHTGLHAGGGNYIENSNPAHLANLFLKYPDVKFILFHGGYPFGGELASLAKNFQNVYIDLCWLYIISPSYSYRYLHEWLETIPANKIMGFGGDYHNAENIYGHLLFAKEIIGNVLIEKVRDGYFSEEEAMKIATMILHDNAVNLFNLKK